MVRDIRRRIATLEARRRVGPPEFDLWVNEGDGILRNRDGRTMTADAFDAAFPDSETIRLNLFEK
jgi:hypothetical protein